ncbi:hypothetical protein E2542_SST06219 [Spatholobus suberectus]|nr:hypothetical protein E2542_SST06219 [Spatholobus suberectus]
MASTGKDLLSNAITGRPKLWNGKVSSPNVSPLIDAVLGRGPSFRDRHQSQHNT